MCRQENPQNYEEKMEVGMSLNALVRLPLSSSRTHEDGLVRHSLCSTRTTHAKQVSEQRQRNVFVVQAKGKKGMMARQFQRPSLPPLPQIEDDGNPRFVIFIRMANVCSLSLSLVCFQWLISDPKFNFFVYSLLFFRNFIENPISHP